MNQIINGYYTPGNEPTSYHYPEEPAEGPLADLVKKIEFMNLPQVAISEKNLEPNAYDFEMDTVQCEKSINKYLSKTLRPREYRSWRKGNEKSLVTNRPISGIEYLLRQRQTKYPVWVRRQEIFESLSKSQLTLVSGRVGDGRSSCIPEIALQYLKATKDPSSILIVTVNKGTSNWLAGRLCKEHGIKNDEDSIRRTGRLEISTDVDQIINLEHNAPRMCVLGANDALRLCSSRPLLDNFGIVIMDDVDKRKVAQDMLFTVVKVYLGKRTHLKFIFISSIGKLEAKDLDETEEDLEMFLHPYKLNHVVIPKVNPVSFNLCQIKFGHFPTKEERLKNIKDILKNVDTDDSDILIICDDHFETEYVHHKLDMYITTQTTLKLIPACKTIKLHSQIAPKTLRKISERMAVRSTMSTVPNEFYQKIEKNQRMIIVTESTLAECCSLSKNVGVVVDLGGYSQKKWDERMQKWTSEIVGINLKQAEARMRRANSNPNVVYRLRDPIRAVNEGEKQEKEKENKNRKDEKYLSRSNSRRGSVTQNHISKQPQKLSTDDESDDTTDDENADMVLPELCWSRLSQQLLLMLKTIRGLTSTQDDYNLDHSLLREPYDIPKFQNGIIELVALDLITANLETFTENLTITDKGLWISEMPLAPEYGAMLVESWSRDCSSEVLRLVAMLIAISKGGLEHWMLKTDPLKSKAVIDEFRSFKGDHFTLLNVLDAFEENGEMITWCKQAGLPHRLLSIARYFRDNLKTVCSNIGLILSQPKIDITEDVAKDVIQCLFLGLQSQAKLGVLQYIAPKPEVDKFGKYELPPCNDKIERDLLKINNQVIGVYKILRYNYPVNESDRIVDETYAIIDLASSCHIIPGHIPKSVIFTCLQESEEKANEKYPNIKILHQAHLNHLYQKYGVRPRPSKITLPENVMKICTEIDIEFLLDNIRFDECDDYELIEKIAHIPKEELLEKIPYWCIGKEKKVKNYRYDASKDYNVADSSEEESSSSGSQEESSSEYDSSDADDETSYQSRESSGEGDYSSSSEYESTDDDNDNNNSSSSGCLNHTSVETTSPDDARPRSKVKTNYYKSVIDKKGWEDLEKGVGISKNDKDYDKNLDNEDCVIM